MAEAESGRSSASSEVVGGHRDRCEGHLDEMVDTVNTELTNLDEEGWR